MTRLASISWILLIAAPLAACDQGFGGADSNIAHDATKEDPLCIVAAPPADNTAQREDAAGAGL
jgi:hypothetical protein